jgi:hypothetical protein
MESMFGFFGISHAVSIAVAAAINGPLIVTESGDCSWIAG